MCPFVFFSQVEAEQSKKAFLVILLILFPCTEIGQKYKVIKLSLLLSKGFNVYLGNHSSGNKFVETVRVRELFLI